MTGPEFRERRTTAGVAIEQVAEIARVPASRADAWERGGRLPYLKRRKLDMALWELERDLALAEPGAPACSVASIRALTSGGPATRDLLLKHVAGCKDCKARGKYLYEHLRPEPYTAGLVLPVLGDVDRLLNWRPADDGASRPEGFWPRVRADAAWGAEGGVVIALCFCGMAAIPMAFMLVLVVLTLISQWTGMATSFFVVEAIPVALTLLLIFPLYLAAGLVGGTIVGILRPLARWRLGTMVLGMIAGTTAYWSMGPVLQALTGVDALSKQHLLTSLGLGSVVGGAAGLFWWSPLEKEEADA